MDQMICCVCQKPVGEDAPRLGRRAYCDEHYARVDRDRGSVWRTSIASVALLVLFGALVAFLSRWVKLDLQGTALVLVGVVLAVVPALIWLVFFYLQDLLEPEPKPYVLGIFLIGGLAASAVGIPLVRNAYAVQNWLNYGFLVNLLGAILVVGFVQEFLKYATVRYSVYMLPEFDERMDGILYGTAAGLGYATMLNIHYVVDSGGVDLGVGIIRIVVTALAQASFAGITGYFLSRAKFEDEPVWWLPLGLTIAATLNGVFTVILGGVTRTKAVSTGQSGTPWLGLVLAAIVAGLTLVVLLYLMQRARRLTLDSGPEAPVQEGGAVS
jgi:RsiW-degrading membrane proteinase PrsW (M82 family)